MKTITLIFGFFAICIHVCGQGIFLDAQPVEGYTSTEYKLNDYLITALSKEHKLNACAFMSISWKLDMSKVTMLEGMNTQISGNPKIKFQLVNKIDNTDTVFFYVANNLKSSSKEQLANLLVETYINEKSNLVILHKMVAGFYEKEFNKKCKIGVEKTKQATENQDFTKALQLCAFYNATTCKKETVELKTKILSEYGKQVCDNDMQKIRILANSGVEYQMVKAIDMLYKIPPKSPCADEAVKLSKTIGKYLLKKSSGESSNDRLNILIKMYTNQDVTSWSNVNMF